ncbi:aspartyl/glutamyl-tRNA(Asn/Gln) amidotransferase subunit C [Alphaproteobacteria bacterium]|nr:aspartyl/glutamyl-tRNA(Asn/Gln) amidotransferase subunit C [Alphaproteobacteria bacterium]
MTVSREDALKVSHLARISIDDSKIDELCNNLNRILSFVEQLNEVDCSQVDDTLQYISSMHERDDVAKPNNPALVLANAPAKECDMFVVPRVVG